MKLNLFKNQNQLVAEIHNEFDSAQERILSEAKEIINNLGLDNKAERLEQIGFTAAESVVKNRDNKAVLVKNREQAETIEYYKQDYPLLKFITEQELKRICDKYKLIYAPVANYKKDVPEKNLKEIETVGELKYSDLPKDRVWCELNYNGTLNLWNIRAKNLGLPFIVEGEKFRGWSEADDYLKKRYSSVAHRSYIVDSVKNFTESRQGLFIAAPQSHFNTKGLSKSGEFGWLKISMVEVKDPIVFRYCRGGIQIISKWGLEAEDKSLVNEKMN